VVNEPAILNVSGVVTDVSIAGGNDGAIDITVSGGIAPYIFSWSTSDGSGLVPGDEDQTGLTSGTYSVLITDANGCTVTDDYTVYEPGALIISATFTNISCHSGSDGTIDLTVSGGVPPYSYAWSTSDGSGLVVGDEDQTGLTAGTYDVIVTDDNGATRSDSYTLTEPGALTIDTEAATDITCNGAGDGTVTVTASGGTGALVYTMNPGAVSNGTGIFTNLAANTYTVSVTDANGCGPVVSGNLLVNEPLPLSIDNVTSTDVTCHGSADGTITIVVSGGVAPYQYSVDGGSNYVSNGGAFTALPAGNFDVAVMDANGCVTPGATEVIGEPPAINISASVTHVSTTGGNDGAIALTVTGGAGGYTYSWSTLDGSGLVPTDQDQSGLTAGTYDVLVTDADGCIAAGSYIVLEPSALVISGTFTNVTCFGDADGSIDVTVTGGIPPYTFTWSTADGSGLIPDSEDQSGLGPGTYDLVVNDAALGSGTASFTITEPEALVLNLTVTDISCFGSNDGQAEAIVTGGTGTIDIIWSTGSSGSSLLGLGPGNYSITITDENGCEVHRDFEIVEPPPLTIDPVVTPATCPTDMDGSIILNLEGGTPPYAITWSDLASTEDRIGIDGGSYHVMVVDDRNCMVEADIEVPFTGRCIEIPKVFTPNNDGYNDTWRLRYVELYPNVSVQIYTRWGKLVYKSDQGYDSPWDGTDNGKSLPIDSYHYIIDLGDGGEPYVGNVSIIK
jgi:gliding motility-associated-like protein